MPAELPEWVFDNLGLDRPNAARVHDYLLGGDCNLGVDRAFADKLLETNPEAEAIVRHNRAFLGRAVRYCVERGIRQFLDLGSGIPTVGSVQDIARRLAPDSRVVYVDNEPVAVAHSRLMLRGDDADVVLADLTDVDAVLGAAPVRRLLDLTRPVAVIMAAVLHFVPDSAKPGRAVARYVDAMAPGSFLVLSHLTVAEEREQQQGRRRYVRNGGAPITGRTREQVRTLMTGTEILDPGVVWTSQWRPEFEPGEHPERARVFAAIGRKPCRHADGGA